VRRPLIGDPMVTAPGPALIGRDAGRELARSELAKPIYHQGGSLADRIFTGIISLLARILRHAPLPGGRLALVGLAALGVLVVLLVGVLLTRVAAIAPGDPSPPGEAVASARDHRARAERLAADRDWAGAIRECLRGIARDLEERGVLPPRAGRTADELAAEAGHALPGHTRELWSAARLFDDVHYGERPGTREGYLRLRALDEGLRAARGTP